MNVTSGSRIISRPYDAYSGIWALIINFVGAPSRLAQKNFHHKFSEWLRFVDYADDTVYIIYHYVIFSVVSKFIVFYYYFNISKDANFIFLIKMKHVFIIDFHIFQMKKKKCIIADMMTEKST